MAYQTPRTWAAGEYPTAAYLNQDLRDNVSWLASPLACKVHRGSSAKSIANNTQTAIDFTTELYDIGNLWVVGSPTRLTVPSGGAGLFHIFGNVRFAANATGTRAVNILLNGTTLLAEDERAASAAAITMCVATDHKLVAGDYVEIRAFQTSGGALNADATIPVYPHFGMRWVGLGT